MKPLFPLNEPPVGFAPRESIEQVEEGDALAPKFDTSGLIVCVTSDAQAGDVLMVGYMNAEALKETMRTGEAHYWSRSRQILWRKGATSGLVQRVEEILVDDDQDAIWLRVSVGGLGASCHVGYKSCFYRSVVRGKHFSEKANLKFAEEKKIFDPAKMYGSAQNPTIL